jgi:outer membrane biosynthesis protein TonB
MKKLFIISALLLIFSDMIAGNENSIQNLITKEIRVPEQLKNQQLNEKVTVSFKIGENGKISVLDVKTSNAELKKEIIKQFNTIDFSHMPENQNIAYSIDINFKVV